MASGSTKLDEAAAWRHSVRGCLNSLKLCVSAFETELSAEEELEFIGCIEMAADKMLRLMDEGEYINLPEPSAPTPAAHAVA